MDNLGTLKDFYYQNLFSMLFKYKVRYKIKDVSALDILEKGIGKIIQKYKINDEDDKLPYIDYSVLDQLDIDIYDKFLSLKALFDEYVPIY